MSRHSGKTGQLRADTQLLLLLAHVAREPFSGVDGQDDFCRGCFSVFTTILLSWRICLTKTGEANAPSGLQRAI